MFAGVWIAVAMATAAVQPASPLPISPGETATGVIGAASAALPDGSRFACYALETAPGEPVTVTLRSDDFDSRLWIARGALCSASGLQYDNDSYGDGDNAQVSFTPAGGRYLILARTAEAGEGGRYMLSVEGGAPLQVAGTDGSIDRESLMRRQVEDRRAQVAAEEAQRRVEEAERRRLAAEAAAQRQAEEAERAASRQAFIGGLLNAATVVANEYSAQIQAETARLQDQQMMIMAAQAAENRRREAEEQGRRQQQQSEQQRQNEAFARQLAEANAYRDRQLASGDLSAEMRQRYERENQQALALAQQQGVAAQMQSQRSDILAGRQGSAMQDQANAEIEAQRELAAELERQRVENARRAEEQRMIREAEERRLAEARRQEQQRLAAETARREEAQRQAEAARQAQAAEQVAIASPPRVGTLTREPSQWFLYGTVNGVNVYWRARIYDRDVLSFQWKCENGSGERKYCSINDKRYDCYAGSALVGTSGAIEEGSDVLPGREYAFGADYVCRGQNATFVIPTARVRASRS